MQTPDQSPDYPSSSTGIESLNSFEVRERIARGWRCVRFELCASLVVATIRRQSAVYLTENWQERYLRGLGYSLVALLCGPWGVPWGLAWTARAVWTNLTGGVDVTDEVLVQLEAKGAAVPESIPESGGTAPVAAHK